MKVTLKTVQGQTYALEANEEDKISDVKLKMERDHKVGDANVMKLIYQGKILSNDETLSSSKVKDGDFLVVMVPKKPPADRPVPQPAGSAPPAVVGGGVAASQPPAAQPQQAAPEGQQMPQQQEQGERAEDGSFVRGAALESTINELMQMGGFSREQVVRCMRAAFNNPDRAAEYLFNGIPPELEREMQQAAAPPAQPAGGQGASPAPAQPAQPSGVPAGGSPGAGPQGGQNPLAALRQLPNFEQFRQMIIQNPQMLQSVMASLAQTHPDLVQAISANPQAFLQLLNEGGGGSAGGAEGQAGQGQAPPPGANVIQVTPEERESINRLMDLGFDQAAVLTAFLACDRNEELAANYLLEHGLELMNDPEAEQGQ